MGEDSIFSSEKETGELKYGIYALWRMIRLNSISAPREWCIDVTRGKRNACSGVDVFLCGSNCANSDQPNAYLMHCGGGHCHATGIWHMRIALLIFTPAEIQKLAIPVARFMGTIRLLELRPRRSGLLA